MRRHESLLALPRSDIGRDGISGRWPAFAPEGGDGDMPALREEAYYNAQACWTGAKITLSSGDDTPTDAMSASSAFIIW